MALVEIERETAPLISKAENFLKENWGGYGIGITLDNLLPIVILQKGSGKVTAYPVFATNPEKPTSSTSCGLWYGEAVGSETGNRLLVVGTTKGFVLSSEEADPGRWSLSKQKPGSSFIEPLFDEVDFFDGWNFHMFTGNLTKNVRMYGCGDLVDNISRKKRKIYLGKFGPIGVSGSDLVSKVHTVLWMMNRFEKKKIVLGNQSSIGQVVETDSEIDGD